jgi:hypothetical protein
LEFIDFEPDKMKIDSFLRLLVWGYMKALTRLIHNAVNNLDTEITYNVSWYQYLSTSFKLFATRHKIRLNSPRNVIFICRPTDKKNKGRKNILNGT